jgi:DNA-binding transcriptional ArsR family regulator
MKTMNPQTALRAVVEPRRRQLLVILRDQGALSVGELSDQVEVSQQAVSQHLKVLEDAGLVEARREGTRHIYAIRVDGFRPIEEFVAAFWGDHLQKLKRSAERK